jgi:hypothetical protein
MLTMLLALGGSAAIYFLMLFFLARQLSAAPLSWRVLGWSGIPIALAGFGFAARFWNPSSGPFIANRLYPFGSHLQTWAVSFGFTWVAFGLLFTGAALFVSRHRCWTWWTLLFSSWLICWWPHGIIGIAFARNGANQQSLSFYTRWGSNPLGFTVLLTEALILLWHFTFSIVGFIATGREVYRTHKQAVLVGRADRLID